MPVSERRAAAYHERMRVLAKRARLANDKGLEGADRVLSDAFERTLRRLEGAKPGTWEPAYSRQLLAAIKLEAQRMGVELDAYAEKEIPKWWALGDRSATEPLIAAVGGESGRVALWAVPRVNPALVNLATGFSSDLIVEISDQWRKRIGREITSGILAGRDRLSILDALERHLGDAAGDRSVFASTRARVKCWYRTETNTVYSLAQDLRGQEIAGSFPEMAKIWVAEIDDVTRPDHEAAHEQRVRMSEQFRVGNVTLGFPRDRGGARGDPKAIAAQTINCRCTVDYDLGRMGDLNELPLATTEDMTRDAAGFWDLAA